MVQFRGEDSLTHWDAFQERRDYSLQIISWSPSLCRLSQTQLMNTSLPGAYCLLQVTTIPACSSCETRRRVRPNQWETARRHRLRVNPRFTPLASLSSLSSSAFRGAYFPQSSSKGTPVLPFLQHRQFLIVAPPSPSNTTRLNRFHREVHLSLLTKDTCPQF